MVSVPQPVPIKDDSYVFRAPQALDNLESTLKTFALTDSILTKTDTGRYASVTSAVRYHFEERKKAIIKGYSLLYLLMVIRKNFEEYRLQLLKRFKSSFRGGFRRVIQLNASLQSTSLFFNTIKREFRDNREWLLHDLNVLSAYIRPRGQDSRTTLKETLSESIEYQMTLLANHLRQIKSSLDEHLNIRNMAVMFMLQTRIVWLTAIVTVATMLTVLLSWEQIKQSIINLVNWLSSN